MIEFMITKNEANQRMDKFLHKYLKEAQTSFLYKMMRKKNIVLNDKKANGKEVLEIGDSIKFYLSDDTIEKFRGSIASSQKDDFSLYLNAYNKYGSLEIIYEDDHILLINKPINLLVQQTKVGEETLNEWLIGYLITTKKITTTQLNTFKPSICNRLDRNTSGIVLCGISLLGSQFLSKLLHNRTLHKYYRTFVHGILKNETILKGYLKKDETQNKVDVCSQKLDDTYVEIHTRYIPITSCKNNITYLEVELITGKTHQIRAHLSSILHPIVGDLKYGGKKVNGINHQILHAYRMEFPIIHGEMSYLSEKVFIANEPNYFNNLKME
ncbi:MAG: RluA family pseudouridine synthase [Lachnospiraceae bacterium]